jgi:hypothetical protein
MSIGVSKNSHERQERYMPYNPKFTKERSSGLRCETTFLPYGITTDVLSDVLLISAL